MTLDAKTLCLRINETFGSVPYPSEAPLVFEDTAGNLEVEHIKDTL